MERKTINIRADLHDRLKICAALHKKKVNELADKAIEMILKQLEEADLTIIHKDGHVSKEYY